MERLLRYTLPVYLILYFFSAFFWRSYRVWKATGVNPFVLGRGDSAHNYIGKVFKIVFVLIAAVVIVYSLSVRVYQYLLPIAWLEHAGLKIAGLFLLAFSAVWTIIAQAQMGESWRIGIDRKHTTALVQKGVFKLSRNPIFLGMIATLAGLFLVMPNGVTLLILALGFVLIQIQVRLEEEHLTTLHRDEYREYQRKVRRWI